MTTLKSSHGLHKEEMISDQKNGEKPNYFKLKSKKKLLKRAHLF